MKFNRLVGVMIIGLLVGCSNAYYATEQERTDQPVHQLMERADQTFVREFDRLDRYCQVMLNDQGTGFRDQTTEVFDDYRLKLCQNIQYHYLQNDERFNTQEARRIRLEALLFDRLSATIDRLVQDKREMDGWDDTTQSAVENPQLNQLYSSETRVDIMMYEWSRVQKEMAKIQSLQHCLKDRDFSQKWNQLLEQFHVQPDKVLYQEACDIWSRD